MLNLLFSNSKIHLLDVYSFVTEIKKNKKERKKQYQKKIYFHTISSNF